MINERLTLADLKMIGPEQMTWPITCRFYYTTPWGWTQQELSLHVPGLAEKYDETEALAKLLWSLTIAPAISRQCQLYATDLVVWRGLAVPKPLVSDTQTGQLFARASTRESSGQLVLLTGDGEPRWRRRFFFGGIPTDWADDNLLTTKGWEGLVAHARGMIMGLGTQHPDPQAEWLVAYPRVVTPTGTNPHGVGFRPVTSVRVCWHTDKAPELSVGGWP